MKGRFVVGIIGAGQIVADCHLPALLASDDAKVSWVADRDHRRAQMVGRTFGIAPVFASAGIEDLPPADVVLLAVPYGARAAMYSTLGKKYEAVYVEKPFALTLDEHDRQCAFFAPERLACGYQRRSLGATQALCEIIGSNLFGELRRIEMGFGRPGIKTGGRYSASLEMAGGGILFEVGVHGLDMALYVTDAMATKAESVTMLKSDGFDLHTEARLCVTRQSGAMIPMELVVTSLEYASNIHVFEFDRATIRFDLFGNAPMNVRARDGSTSFVLTGALLDYPRTSNQVFHEHWRLFFEGIRAQSANATSATATRVTTQAVEQLYTEGLRD